MRNYPKYVHIDLEMFIRILKTTNSRKNFFKFFSTAMNTGKNLNTGFVQFQTASDLYTHIRDITKPGGDYTVRNFVGVIHEMSPPEKTLVPTELFPIDALEYYTNKNLELEVTKEAEKKFKTDMRGGAQGDYTDGMQLKIKNVIDCLKEVSVSKRAVITIPFSSEGSKFANYKDQGQTKCLRELHFYIEDNKLKCTGIFRMQNANIFPKNIHFIANQIKKELNLEVGEYTHFITNLCHDRDAIHC
eukprot:snap_masked-scaffold_16-processed-gene-3.17-mRNA-1 protein AED:0.09 eAED:0.09 QI:0/0/0/1/1/1/2/0/244